MSDPRRTISPERKAIYYLGMAAMVIGFLTFGSIFISAARHFGDFSNFESDARSSMTRAIIGMGLMIVGGIFASIGRAGLGGAGVVLDPQRARRDLEPWNRAAGGMLNDALDEAPVLKNALDGKPEAPIVKVKCRECGSLNDEQARFCSQCGKSL